MDSNNWSSIPAGSSGPSLLTLMTAVPSGELQREANHAVGRAVVAGIVHQLVEHLAGQFGIAGHT